MSVILEIKDVSVDFAVDEEQVHILKNLSINIQENEVLAVFGETSSRKSVTGGILLIGQERTKMDENDLHRLYGNKMECAILLITHGLDTVKYLADRIVVLYCGEIVEIGPAEMVINYPLHPYTKGLIASAHKKGFDEFNGFTPTFSKRPKGCQFSERCDCTSETCFTDEPEMTEISEGHFTKCSIYKNLYVSEYFRHAI